MKFFSLQGKFSLAPRLSTGKPGAIEWMGDVPAGALNISGEDEKIKESWSGVKGTAALLPGEKEVTISLTLNQALASNLALALGGTVNNVVAGSATAELFPTGVTAGQVFQLDNSDIASLVITDSAGSPATVDPSKYEIVDAKAGQVKILDVTGFTQPFKAAYSYGAVTRISMLTASASDKYLIFDGLNVVRGAGDRMKFRLYKIQFKNTEALELINSAQGQITLVGEALMDPVNVLDPLLGAYGRIELLGSNHNEA